jgi:hypothetical protein
VIHPRSGICVLAKAGADEFALEPVFSWGIPKSGNE